MAANWNGQLTKNEVISDMFNAVVARMFYLDNVEGIDNTLVEMMRVDGGKFGDTRLYTAAKIPYPKNWLNDKEAAAYLEIHRPQAMDTQAIQINVFKKIHLSTDIFMSARIFETEYGLAEMNGLIVDTIRQAKKAYDYTTLYTYIGTTETSIGKQNRTVNVTAAVGDTTGQEALEIEGEVIGEDVSNLLIDCQDLTRDYNDYGNRRSYPASKLVFGWNSKAMTRVQHRSLPSLYHNQVVDRLGEYAIPARFLGKPNDKNKTTSDSSTRALAAMEIKAKGSETLLEAADVERGGEVIRIAKGATLKANDVVLLYAGDLLPSGTTIATSTAVTIPTYQEDGTILYKVFTRGSVPFMSGFMVDTSWYVNPALVDQHMLIWSHNDLQYLYNEPFITVRKA